VRIASNTKTFVAAAVLRLWELGWLEIDDPIELHLAPEHVAMLRGDGYDPTAITVRHLLTHTSGLFDHSSVDAYVQRIMADPRHHWTRTEQLQCAVAWGDPYGAPGEFYTYCDTGYVLLGEVVERTAGRPLAAAVRDLLDYRRLGMNATWWEVLEDAPEGVEERAHQFLGPTDVYGFAPYYDLYGGGGIVCTVGDLARLWRGLAGGELFDELTTIDVMLSTIPDVKALPDAGEGALPPGAYRMGLWETEVSRLRAYRHSGFFGTSVTWVPDLELVVAVTVNQNRARAALNALSARVVEVVREAPGAR
jgi:D-alanyl-D-alanine carboxypeptidase